MAIAADWREAARSSAMGASAGPGESAIGVAGVRALLGDRSGALDVLERAVAAHDAIVVNFKVDPWLDPLRAEPRFEALMRRLDFPQ